MKKIIEIPVWEYAKRVGKDRQTIYRWIREGKITPEKVVKKEKTVERIFIRV